MYSRVPKTLPFWKPPDGLVWKRGLLVVCWSSRSLMNMAMPKSASFAIVWDVLRRMLAGLMSRWTMP